MPTKGPFEIRRNMKAADSSVMISSWIVDSVDKCELRCKQLETCTTFTFERKTGFCFAYSRADLVANGDFDSGIRDAAARHANQPAATGVTGLFTIRTNTEASGASDLQIPYVRSISECEQKCAQSAPCKTFAYNKTNQMCYGYTFAYSCKPNEKYDSGIRK